MWGSAVDWQWYSSNPADIDLSAQYRPRFQVAYSTISPVVDPKTGGLTTRFGATGLGRRYKAEAAAAVWSDPVRQENQGTYSTYSAAVEWLGCGLENDGQTDHYGGLSGPEAEIMGYLQPGYSVAVGAAAAGRRLEGVEAGPQRRGRAASARALLRAAGRTNGGNAGEVYYSWANCDRAFAARAFTLQVWAAQAASGNYTVPCWCVPGPNACRRRRRSFVPSLHVLRAALLRYPAGAGWPVALSNETTGLPRQYFCPQHCRTVLGFWIFSIILFSIVFSMCFCSLIPATAAAVAIGPE